MVDSSSSRGSQSSSGTETKKAGHFKVVTVKNRYNSGDGVIPNDPRGVVLGIDEYEDLVNQEVPSTYFEEATNNDARLLPIQPDVVANRFQASLVSCLLNLSPLLNLLKSTGEDHKLYYDETRSDWVTLLELSEIFLDETKWVKDSEKFVEKFVQKGETAFSAQYGPKGEGEEKLKVTKEDKEKSKNGLNRAGMEPPRTVTFQDERDKQRYEEAGFVASTLEAFRQAVNLPVNQVNPEAFLDTLKEALADKENYKKDDEDKTWVAVRTFDRILSTVRIPREQLEPCSCGESQWTPRDNILSNEGYSWPLDLPRAEETRIERLIANERLTIECPKCKLSTLVDEFPRMLYPPEILITRHAYSIIDKDGVNSIGSLKFPEYLDLTDVMEPDGGEGEEKKEEMEEEEYEKIYRLQAVISCRWDGNEFVKDYYAQLRRREDVWSRLHGTDDEETSETVSFEDILYDDDYRPVMLFWVRDRAAKKPDLEESNPECSRKSTEEPATPTEEKTEVKYDRDPDEVPTDEVEFDRSLVFQLRSGFLNRSCVQDIDGNAVTINVNNPIRVLRQEEALATQERPLSDDEDDWPDDDDEDPNTGPGPTPGPGDTDTDDVNKKDPKEPKRPIEPKRPKDPKNPKAYLIPLNKNDPQLGASQRMSHPERVALMKRLGLVSNRGQIKSPKMVERHYKGPRDYDDYTAVWLRQQLERVGKTLWTITPKPALVNMCVEYDKDQAAADPSQMNEDEEEEENDSGPPSKKPKSS
ncbi:uncharacterized protein PG986_000710 [Apiospora aurea]|uniref:USP domain-containing protein n=1 Tax=Apiospora aurea TaxID=335848 RepID=A0ABR1QUV6_9PEZI